MLFIYCPYLYGMKTYIYALVHPETKEIKYVGKTDRPKARLREHITDSRKPGRKNKREAWIKSLLNNELKPELIILEKVTKDEWKKKEREWIARYKGQLKNDTDGGDGIDGYKHTPESLFKMKPSWIKKGQHLSPKTQFKKGFKHTQKWKDHNSKISKGRKHSKEARKRMSIAQKKSAKKRNLSELMKGNQYGKGFKWSDKSKKQLSKSKMGHFVSQETRDKIKVRVSKPVIQYDKKGDFIKEWESGKYAAKTLNIGYKAINNNLNNLATITGGFIWEYKK